MVVIEEEFGIKLSFDQLWELGTFQAIEKHLLERCQLTLSEANRSQIRGNCL